MRHAATETYRLDPLDAGLTHYRADEPDHEQAVYWFRVAADAGSAEGLAMLGLCQLEGQGLPHEPTQARERLEQAAAAGSLTGQYHLGRMLVAGWGGAADAPRGVALYTAAAALGHAEAVFNLAHCLHAGWGCHTDHLAAKALFLRARALGSHQKLAGLRIRQRELGAVRELAQRLRAGTELAPLIAERQHEIALMQSLARERRARPRLDRRQRQRLLRTASLAAIAAGLVAALAGLIGGRGAGAMPHDAGPSTRARS